MTKLHIISNMYYMHKYIYDIIIYSNIDKYILKLN